MTWIDLFIKKNMDIFLIVSTHPSSRKEKKDDL